MLDNYTYLPAWWALLSYYTALPLHVYMCARERAYMHVYLHAYIYVNLTTVDIAEDRGRRPDP